MSNMITVEEAINLVARTIAEYNPYKGNGDTSAYNDRLRNQALAFIESVIDQITPDLKPFDGYFEHGFLTIENVLGETDCYSFVGSTVDSEALSLLAQKHYSPLSSPQKQKQAKQKNLHSVPQNIISSTDDAKKMSNKRWEESRKMKDKIEQFVIQEALRDGCTCTHMQMYRVLESADIDGKMLLDTLILSEDVAKKHVKKVYAEKVSKDRIAPGAPPKQNNCPAHKL